MGGHVRTFARSHTRYRLIYVDGVQVLEHREVMERFLGRKLSRREIVHHRDGNGLNNDVSNLEILTPSAHRREHAGPRHWDLADAISMRATGATIKSIATKYGVGPAAINKALKRRGHSTAAPPRKLRFDRETAFRLYADGTPIKHIAKSLGVAGPSIRKALIKAGLLKHGSAPSPSSGAASP